MITVHNNMKIYHNHMIVLFTHNNTAAMSKALHSEAELMKRLQWCNHVRICSK